MHHVITVKKVGLQRGNGGSFCSKGEGVMVSRSGLGRGKQWVHMLAKAALCESVDKIQLKKTE